MNVRTLARLGVFVTLATVGTRLASRRRRSTDRGKLDAIEEKVENLSEEMRVDRGAREAKEARDSRKVLAAVGLTLVGIAYGMYQLDPRFAFGALVLAAVVCLVAVLSVFVDPRVQRGSDESS